MKKLVAMVNKDVFLQSGSSFAFGRFVSRGFGEHAGSVSGSFKLQTLECCGFAAQMFANSQASFRLFKLVYPSPSLTNPLDLFTIKGYFVRQIFPRSLSVS